MAATGHREAREALINLWGSLGREDELRELATVGNASARRQLIQLLDRLGRQEELRRMAAAEDLWASGHRPGTTYSTDFTDLF